MRCSDLARAAALFLVVFSLSFVSYSRLLPDGADEMLYFGATQSFAKWQIASLDQVSTVGPAPEELGPDGHRYSKKAPLSSLIAVPLFWLAQRLPVGAVDAVLLTNHIVSALVAAIFFLFVRRLGYSGRVALVLSLVLAFGTPLWVYAKSLLPESTIALCVIVTLGATHMATTSNRSRWLVAAGAGFGAAVAAKNIYVLLLLPVPLYLWWMALRGSLPAVSVPKPAGSIARRSGAILLRSLKPLVWFCLGAAPFVGLVLAYSYMRYGTPFSTGYGDWETFSTPVWEGVAGILFSPGKSILAYTPLLVLLPFWAPAFARRYRGLAVQIVAIVALHLVVYGSWYVWWGGWSWASRFTVPILPLLLLLMAGGLARARRPAMVLLVFVLVALGLAVQVLGVAVHNDVYLKQLLPIAQAPDVLTIWDLSRSPILQQVPLLTREWLDFAWVRASGAEALNLAALGVVLSALGCSIVCAAVVWRASRRSNQLVAVGVAVPVVFVATFLALNIYYTEDDQDVVAIAAALEQAPDGAAVLHMAPLLVAPYFNSQKRSLPELGWIEEPRPSPLIVARIEEIAKRASELWVITDTPAKAPGNGVEALLNRSMVEIEQQSIGAVRLLRYATRPSTVEMVSASYRFADGIELIGFRAERTTGKAGSVLNVTLAWQAGEERVSRPDYMVFVHVLNSEGKLIAQADGPPASGYVATSGWQPKRVVYDLHSAVLPLGDPSEPRILVGLYNLSDGKRLALVGPHDGIGSDSVTLSTVRNR